ncbi:MAG: AzlD domain-containing protein [Chloroflexi bacterium]|nr:AzlD domain-containing protein [Chloroflexota bacterium]
MILGMALVTFGVRYPILALVSKIQLPESILSALKFVPPAVLSAIILPEVLISNGDFQLNFNNSELVASLAAGLIAWRTKNLLLTIVLGMLVFLGWRWLLGA